MTSVKGKILARIRRLGPSEVFTPKDLLDIAPRGSVDMALKALTAEGTIRRIGRGLYDIPRESQLVSGPLPASLDQIARAIARRHRWTILPHGPLAANLWGLSTQVPARTVYISSGPSKSFDFGKQRVEFRHASPKETAVESERAGAIIQALRDFGRRRVDDELIARLRSRLSAKDKRELLRDARHSADWIYQVAKRIAGTGSK